MHQAKYCAFFLFLLSAFPAAVAELPDWEFRRAAVYRPGFDAQTSIEVARMRPDEAVDIEVMYPKIGYSDAGEWRASPAGFAITGGAGGARWLSDFNPFACYELSVAELPIGSGVFWTAENLPEKTVLRVSLTRESESQLKVEITGSAGEKVLVKKTGNREKHMPESQAIRLIIQGQGSGFAVYCAEANARPELVCWADMPAELDFRQVKRLQKTQVGVGAAGASGNTAPVVLREARSFFSAGVGIADLRAITLPGGETFIENGRVFVTASLRGRGLPHVLQGVLSFNPTLFDLRLEGVIVFDRGDGLWRNEIASHLVHDPATQEWFGITTGFSAYGDADKKVGKQLWAFRTKLDPRRGFSVVPATPTGLSGDIEDPSLFYDAGAKKWRIAFCQGGGAGYRAVLYESERPSGDFVKINGPVKEDSTGTQIVRFGTEPKVLYGSSAKNVFIASYPDLKPEGTLKYDLAPWRDGIGTRVWPNVIPLPAGYPWPAVIVTMDRVNEPGMPRSNWTYGAVYFYRATQK